MTHGNHPRAEYPDEAPLERRVEISPHWRTLWRCKYFILGVSVLVAAGVGAFLYFSPRTYSVTYIYDSWEALDAPSQQILFHTFYSDKSIGRIIADLEKGGHKQRADEIALAADRGPETPRDVIDLEVWPAHTDTSKQTALDATEAEERRKLEGDMLVVTLRARSREELSHLVTAVRDNLERQIPVVFLARAVKEDLHRYRSRIAQLVAERFELESVLKHSREIIQRLREIQTAAPRSQGTTEGGMALHFHVDGSSEYFPVAYQVELKEAEVAKRVSDLEAKQAELKHYRTLEGLTEEMLRGLAEQNYDLPGFLLHVESMAESSSSEDARDYLISLSKRVANWISSSRPLVDTPWVTTLSRGVVWKTGVTFLAMLVLTSGLAIIHATASQGGRPR